MRHLMTDVLVIGGGAAGMASALSAAKEGAMVTLIEREDETSGVLNQCIHNGFGLHFYHEEFIGPEFAWKLEDEISKENIKIICQSYVREIDVKNKRTLVISPEGAYDIESKSIVIATGARERPFGALMIAGDRPSGIFTAGLAQRFVNLENRLPGKKALVLGSGDIGLIMARRLTLEGMEVVGVVERMPYPGGLTRNIVQCLDDFNIPLYLSHTVTEVKGSGRLQRVIVSKVDEQFRPIEGTKMEFSVDTLILSAGLIPQVENFDDELLIDPVNRGFLVSNLCETSTEGVFAAGNNVAVFDLVDYVAAEGWVAGRHAARYAHNETIGGDRIPAVRGSNVSVLVPGLIDPEEHLRIYLRLSKPMDKGVLVLRELGIKKEFTYGVPSEMVQLVVNKEKLKVLSKIGRLTVEVLE